MSYKSNATQDEHELYNQLRKLAQAVDDVLFALKDPRTELSESEDALLGERLLKNLYHEKANSVMVLIRIKGNPNMPRDPWPPIVK